MGQHNPVATKNVAESRLYHWTPVRISHERIDIDLSYPKSIFSNWSGEGGGDYFSNNRVGNYASTRAAARRNILIQIAESGGVNEISRTNIDLLMKEILKYLSLKSFDVIDQALADVDVGVINPAAMVCFARTTGGFRSMLKHWTSFVLSCRKELNERNLDSEKILRGLPA